MNYHLMFPLVMVPTSLITMHNNNNVLQIHPSNPPNVRRLHIVVDTMTGTPLQQTTTCDITTLSPQYRWWDRVLTDHVSCATGDSKQHQTKKSCCSSAFYQPPVCEVWS